MLANLSIRFRLLSLAAISIFGFLTLGLVGSYELWRFNGIVANSFDDAVVSIKSLYSVETAEAAFKEEVKIWLNILIRGNNKADFDSLKESFEEEDARVQKGLKEFLEILKKSGTPVDLQLASEVEIVINGHRDLSLDYHSVLDTFNVDDPEAGKKADRSAE